MQFNNINENPAKTYKDTTVKRTRAPIACYRCHHKKVRCDGIHPNCTRCLSTGVLCAYPSSRRSRNTQPVNVDPFINNLSQLEAKIRRIETDLESQRNLVQILCGNNQEMSEKSASSLNMNILQTERDLQDSRSIVAQLRLYGEKRTAKGNKKSISRRSSHDKNKQDMPPSLPVYMPPNYYIPYEIPLYEPFLLNSNPLEKNNFTTPSILDNLSHYQDSMPFLPQKNMDILLPDLYSNNILLNQ